MEPNISSPSEILHSAHHSKLSAEEIAKALARHNRHHPVPTEQGAEKLQKASKNASKN
jgi:hypothetical protein